MHPIYIVIQDGHSGHHFGLGRRVLLFEDKNGAIKQLKISCQSLIFGRKGAWGKLVISGKERN